MQEIKEERKQIKKHMNGISIKIQIFADEIKKKKNRNKKKFHQGGLGC